MKFSKPGSSLLFLLLIVVICAAAIAGCGGGGTTTVTVTEPASTAPPTAETPASNGKDAEVTEEAGVVAGYVDNAISESGLLILYGWAAAPDLSAPASKVIASVGKKHVAEAVPTIEREDVVEALGKPGLKDSGFELKLPTEALDCGAKDSGVKVTAELKGHSGPIEFGEGIRPKLNEAC